MFISTRILTMLSAELILIQNSDCHKYAVQVVMKSAEMSGKRVKVCSGKWWTMKLALIIQMCSVGVVKYH